MKNTIKINIPLNTKMIVWSDKKNLHENINFWFINKEKMYKLSVNTKNKLFVINKWSNNIYIKRNKIIDFNVKINNLINIFLRSWNFYFFNKIKFKGKGFRIKMFKKIKLIKFYFGRSHKTFVLLRKIKKIRINKYKFLLISLNKRKNIDNCNKIIKIKPVNVYTLRGLRKSKQIIYKRKGKKGTYI